MTSKAIPQLNSPQSCILLDAQHRVACKTEKLSTLFAVKLHDRKLAQEPD